MKPLFAMALIGWGLSLAAATAGPPAASAETLATTSSTGPPRDVSATLAPLIQRHRIPAMVAAVVHDARIVTLGAAGVRKRGELEPVTTDDRFHLGSETKSMTATLCAMLVEDGKLRWDSTLAGIFPDLKATMLSDYHSVTLEQLLTQRSGFGEPEKICTPDFLEKLVAFKGTPAAARRMALEYVVTRKPEAPRGSRFIYSNVNYVLAGHMAETVAGRPWEELMRERLFIPLGMSSAGFGAPGRAEVLDEPRGHRVDGRPVEPGPAADNPTGNAPAGAVHCSLRDWAKFAAFHSTRGQSHPGLLKRESFAILHAAGNAIAGGPNGQEAATSDDYAMGWFVLSNGVLVHSGSNTFWLAKLAVIPKERVAVLVACNQGGEEAEKGCNTALQNLLTDYLRQRAPADHKAGDVVIEPASLSTPGSGSIPFDLGTIYVPENRADPNSRIIGVGFARFRASKPTEAPPTFHLPGGPGDSLVMPLTNGSPSMSVTEYLDLFRSVGDVVLVDQRGYSPRGELLKFNYHAPQPLDQPASLARQTAAFVGASRAATAEFAKKGIDLRGYTVKECADDVNDLRKALRYEQITLVGGSFGSQWSFAVVRRHSGIVARALLAGVEPLNCGYDMPSHVLAAVQRRWWEAEKDPRLKPYLPPGGLMAAARQLLERLERKELRVEVTDDKTGKPVTVVLGPEDFRQHFLPLAANPSLLLSLYHGQAYDDCARAVLGQRRDGEGETPLICPLIDTSLGVTPQREFLLRTDPATSLLGHWNFDSFLATAPIWPSTDVGDDFRTEVACQVPVVFVQGDWDTSTPVENLLDVAPYFPKGRMLIVRHGGHDALGPMLRHQPDALAALLEFLKTGNAEQLPVSVSLPVPQFAVPGFPPPASADESKSP